MLSKEVLQAHYVEYASQSDEWVQNMEITKRSIVEQVVSEVQFVPSREPVKVVVLGASDKRYISIHARVFSEVLNKKIDMRTFDIDVDHLGGASDDVVVHDVTEPFPGAPYDIVFSHELMKFLTPEEQFQTIKNSFQALSADGLAMHIMHEPSIKGTSELKSWQKRFNPDELLELLKSEGIPAKKLVFQSKSDVDWLRETTVIAITKSAPAPATRSGARS